MAIRAVISDFGGVLTTPLFEAFKAYGEASGVTPEDLSRAIQLETDAGGGRHPLYELEKGHITEAEFIRRLESHLRDGARLDGFRETYFANLHPNEAMIEFMRELRDRGLRMGMLTNNIREWEPLWRAKIPDIDAIFELIVDSAFVGMRKPEPEIYALTLERMGGGLAAGDCLFVDDIDVNCGAARYLGMTAVHFRSAEQTIPEIEAALRRSA